MNGVHGKIVMVVVVEVVAVSVQDEGIVVGNVDGALGAHEIVSRKTVCVCVCVCFFS